MHYNFFYLTQAYFWILVFFLYVFILFFHAIYYLFVLIRLVYERHSSTAMIHLNVCECIIWVNIVHRLLFLSYFFFYKLLQLSWFVRFARADRSILLYNLIFLCYSCAMYVWFWCICCAYSVTNLLVECLYFLSACVFVAQTLLNVIKCFCVRKLSRFLWNEWW